MDNQISPFDIPELLEIVRNQCTVLETIRITMAQLVSEIVLLKKDRIIDRNLIFKLMKQQKNPEKNMGKMNRLIKKRDFRVQKTMQVSQ